MNKKKVLVIGLDGATFDLIGSWINDGSLPTLQKLKKEGVAGALETVFPPITAAAWSSFATGKNPGKHGVYDFLHRKDNSYQMGISSTVLRHTRTIWDILGEAGKQVGIINVPLTYPPSAVNGFMVTGFMTPRADPVHTVNYTFPVQLKEEIREVAPHYAIYPKTTYKAGNIVPYVNGLKDMVTTRAKTVTYLMDNKPWDFMMAVFQETDFIYHNLIHLLYPEHPMHNREEVAGHKDLLLSFHKHLDDKLHDILSRLDDDTTVVIMSDHGMGPIYKWIYLNNWLVRAGFLKFKNDPVSLLKRALFRAGFTPSNIYRIVTKFGFSKASFGQETRYNIIEKYFLSSNNIDWSKTSAYAAGHVGQIFINLKGREPGGIVEQGQDYYRVRDAIRAALLDLKDPETNEPVVEKVFFKEYLYAGQYLDKAADVLFLPARLEYWSLGVSSFVNNRIVGPAFGNSGNHRMNGIFMMKGKDIRKGRQISGARIIDVVPTILFDLGLPVPADMDGKVLGEIFETSYRQSNQIHRTIPEEVKTEEEVVIEKDEENDIKESLRRLGYLS